MIHVDLFSGIGGFAYAIDQIFYEEKNEHIFVDNDKFCQAVLKKHWPEAEIHGDIRRFITDSRSAQSRRVSGIGRKKMAEVGGCYLLTGGFPCQPFSHAGRRKGTADNRYLWPQMLESISLFQPEWVIAENVRGLVTWNDGMVFEQVCADLEKAGYEVRPFIIPAVAVNAPHRRDRVWIVANYNGQGCKRERDKRTKQTRKEKCARCIITNWDRNWLEVATRLCVMDDGLPGGLVRPRGWRNAALKAAGNAIVPQVVMEILKAIKKTNESTS